MRHMNVDCRRFLCAFFIFALIVSVCSASFGSFSLKRPPTAIDQDRRNLLSQLPENEMSFSAAAPNHFDRPVLRFLPRFCRPCLAFDQQVPVLSRPLEQDTLRLAFARHILLPLGIHAPPPPVPGFAA